MAFDSALRQQVIAALSPEPTLIGKDTLIWRGPNAPVSHYVRFFGERACKTNVRHPHDPDTVLGFMRELEAADLDAVTAERPIAVRPSAAVQKTRFEARIVVHPSVARTSCSGSTIFMAKVTSLTLPAFACEFPADDTPAEALYRIKKSVAWSDWARVAEPALSVRFRRIKGKIATTSGKSLGIGKADQAEHVLIKIGEEDGFLEVENYRRERVTFRHENGLYELELATGPQPIARDQVLGWFNRFITSGMEGAERSHE